jgi:di/tricarboxylate transporter
MNVTTALGLDARRAAILSVIAAATLAIALSPSPVGDQRAMLGLAVVVATVSLFATGAVHGLAISLIFFVLALATSTASIWTLISGFWANATLLIFGGLIIGASVDRSGLGRWVARTLLRGFLGSYPRLLLGVLVCTAALSFLVPSTMGRLAITLPIAIGMAQEVGYERGSNGYNAVVLTAVAGNFLTAFAILPANLVNVIANGTAERLYGPQVGYVEHLIQYGPVLGLLKGVMFLGLALLLFPAPPPKTPPAGEPMPMSRDAKRLAILLAITVSLWATDFLHGLKTGWIACAAGLLCLVPPISLMRAREALNMHRLNAVVSVPAALGLASVLVQSGAGKVVSASALGFVSLEGASPSFGFLVLGAVTSVITLLTTTVGAVAIVTPLLETVSSTTGLSIRAGLVAEMVGLQCLFFHYEAVPIIVGLALGSVTPGVAARLMVPLAATGLVVILPLMLLWLKFLGVVP